MNAHVITYPSLQRRIITQRRSRALFLVRNTQQMRTRTLCLTEIARAIIAATSLIAWCASLLLIAG